MSADNYMHIIKRNGKYVVQNRSASSYYADEGYSKENPPHDSDGNPQPDWIQAPGRQGAEFATLDAAEAYAYSEYSEYGVSYGFPVRRYTVEVEDTV